MKYFTYDEFDSPDEPGSGREFMDEAFLEMLDNARYMAGIPFRINSGYRTKEHNDRIGGKSNSSHLYGYAADIHCNDNGNRKLIVAALFAAGFNRVGVAKTFIHVDNDPEKVPDRMWLY